MTTCASSLGDRRGDDFPLLDSAQTSSPSEDLLIVDSHDQKMKILHLDENRFPLHIPE